MTLATFPTNTPQLPVQPSFSGADGVNPFSVPAGYYDGSETATAVDSDLVAGNIKNGITILGVGPGTYSGSIVPSAFALNIAESQVRLGGGSGALGGAKTYSDAVYDTGTDILGFTILFQPGPSYTVIVQEYSKADNTETMINSAGAMGNYSSLNSIYINAGVVCVNYVITGPANRNIKYTIATNSWAAAAVGFDTSGILLTNSVPYLGYTAKHYISFDSSAGGYGINCFELT